MLQISHLKKSYLSQVLFDDITITVGKGEKVGMVGRNGSGKSTLFKLITHEEEVDEGQIIMPNRYHVGALKQFVEFSQDTILKECCLSLPKGHEHEEFIVKKIMTGLGFNEQDYDKSPAVFSGGYQIRLQLAKLLVTNPDMLLLDEPTNYLDIVSIRWLKNFLKEFKGEFILITHDKGFMNEVCTHTMGIHRAKVFKTKGSTAKYYQVIQDEEENYQKQKKKQDQAVKKMQTYIDKYRATARRANQAQSRLKKLAKIQEMNELEQDDNLAFRFNYKDCPAKYMAEFKDINFKYPGMEKDLINNYNLHIKQTDRIAIIGKNGAGKSTLLNLMAGELAYQKGSHSTHTQTEIALFGQMNIQRLNEKNSVEDEIASANIEMTYGQTKAICGLMMFERDLSTKKVAVLSGGERSRVLLGKILAKPVNLLLLDEPTNHLDQESIDGLLDGLEHFPGAVIMVTHSEMILRRFAKKLIVLQHDDILEFEGSYDDFLRRIGWDDESDGKFYQKPTSKLSKKDIRRESAMERTERNRIIKPLRKKIKSLENKIQKLETKASELTQELLEVSTTKNVEKQISLAKEIKDNEKEIEGLYDELGVVTNEYELLISNF